MVYSCCSFAGHCIITLLLLLLIQLFFAKFQERFDIWIRWLSRKLCKATGGSSACGALSGWQEVRPSSSNSQPQAVTLYQRDVVSPVSLHGSFSLAEFQFAEREDVSSGHELDSLVTDLGPGYDIIDVEPTTPVMPLLEPEVTAIPVTFVAEPQSNRCP